MVNFIELVGIGIFVSMYGTMIGLGGGFILVPILLLIYKLNPQYAIGTSLCVIFFNAISGTFSYARQKRIDYVTGFNFAIGTIPGCIIGAYLTKFFTLGIFNVIFGIMLIILAVLLLKNPQPIPNADKSRCFPFPFLKKKPVLRELIDADGKKFIYAFNMPCGIALSFIVGFISSLLGIGGGVVHVPALIYMFCFPVHIAIASSTFILSISTFVGSISHLIIGNVVFKFALPIAIGCIFGATVGAKLSKILKSTIIVRLLATGLVFVGIKLLLK
jgi:uncharacterized membrane protein YfcA